MSVQLVRGRIYPRVGQPPVEALAVKDGMVVGQGTAADLRDRFPVTSESALAGTVLPGFHDAHAHPTMTAANSLRADLSPERVSDEQSMVDALTAERRRTGARGWVVGARYDAEKTTGGRVVDRTWLDRVVPDRPALVIHVAAHWGVLNTSALEAAGFTDDTPDPKGGALGRDGDGHLNGVVYEQALFDVAYPSMALRPVVLPPSSLEDRLRGWSRTQEMFHAAGITSTCDALCGPEDVTLLQEARRREELTLRTSFLVAAPHVDHLVALGLRSGFGDDRLRLVGVKAMLDGACAGGNCLVEQPFVGTADHGMQTMSGEEIRSLVHRCDDVGLAVGVHANGDRAIRLLLEAFESLPSAPSRRPRHRVEHCTLIDDDIVRRLRSQGLVAVPFGSYAWFHGDKLEPLYGPERLERMFAHRTLLEAGVPTAGSSDYPCGPIEVTAALDSCVNRLAMDGSPVGPSQRISVEDALRLYTEHAAYACGEERTKGALEEGRVADFVELSDDPHKVPPAALGDLRVRSTWVAGTPVHHQ
jgi:predicted amidohydrolase YtcJ